MERAVFSDIDGTLIHKKASDIEIEKGGYISKDTIGLIEKLRRQSYFILSTGRRKANYERIAGAIPHDIAMIEHGCVIIENGIADNEWLESIGSDAVIKYAEVLKREGYRVDSEGRLASVRVIEGKYKERDLEAKISGESALSVVRNQGMLDIIPSLGGKEMAALYISKKKGLELKYCAALVDDLNDLSLIRVTGTSLCPASANPKIKNAVADMGGYVSAFKYQRGTEDILAQAESIISRKA